MIDKLHVLGEDIYIGYSPEHDVKEYHFDLREYLSEWPDTVPKMLATRPFEKDTYIVKTERVDHVIVWRPTSYDTAKTGVGKMWVAFFGKDGKKLGLTPVTITHILSGPPNIDGNTPPEMRPSWVQDVLDAAKRAEDAADRAENAGEGGPGTGGAGIPSVTQEDNGKVLTVIDGKWAAGELPKYDGAYEVTPRAEEETTLLTAQKMMDGNVTVKKIPYYETSNESGGNTVYIGTEV